MSKVTMYVFTKWNHSFHMDVPKYLTGNVMDCQRGIHGVSLKFIVG